MRPGWFFHWKLTKNPRTCVLVITCIKHARITIHKYKFDLMIINPCAMLKIRYLNWCSRSKLSGFLEIACNHSLFFITTQFLHSVYLSTCFFQLPQVFFFFLELIGCKPHWSELIHLSFWVKKALSVDNFGNVHSKTEVRKFRSMRPTINQFQKDIQNQC